MGQISRRSVLSGVGVAVIISPIAALASSDPVVALTRQWRNLVERVDAMETGPEADSLWHEVDAVERRILGAVATFPFGAACKLRVALHYHCHYRPEAGLAEQDRDVVFILAAIDDLTRETA